MIYLTLTAVYMNNIYSQRAVDDRQRSTILSLIQDTIVYRTPATESSQCTRRRGSAKRFLLPYRKGKKESVYTFRRFPPLSRKRKVKAFYTSTRALVIVGVFSGFGLVARRRDRRLVAVSTHVVHVLSLLPATIPFELRLCLFTWCGGDGSSAFSVTASVAPRE